MLDLVRELRDDTGAAILLIAHNLGVIRTMCDRVGVMCAGRIVEEGSRDELLERAGRFADMWGLQRSGLH